MSMYDPPQDEYNPYATPRAEMRREPEYAGLGGPPLEFGIGEVLSRSWEIFQGRLGLTIGVWFLTFVINVGGQIVYNLAIIAATGGNGNIKGPGDAAIVFVAWVTLVIFLSWINLGLTSVMLRIAREQPADIGGLFSGGRYLFPWILAAILIGLICIPIVIVAVVPVAVAGAAFKGDQASVALAGVGGFVMAGVLGVALGIRVSQAIYLIVDRGVGPMESLNLSMKLTKGKFWSIFVIYLLCFGINALGFVALLIGLIFTVPFTTLILAVTYASMVGKPIRAEELKFTPELDFHDDLA